MMVSFGRHGTGSAAAAVTYLLGERDAAGLERGHVAVLRGDPQLVADLADSRNQVWRYSAGVIAWHRDDRPTDAQIRAVLDDFETFTAGGLAEPMTLDCGAAWHPGGGSWGACARPDRAV